MAMFCLICMVTFAYVDILVTTVAYFELVTTYQREAHTAVAAGKKGFQIHGSHQ